MTAVPAAVLSRLFWRGGSGAAESGVVMRVRQTLKCGALGGAASRCRDKKTLPAGQG